MVYVTSIKFYRKKKEIIETKCQFVLWAHSVNNYFLLIRRQKMSKIPNIRMNNGLSMPGIGLGTFQVS